MTRSTRTLALALALALSPAGHAGDAQVDAEMQSLLLRLADAGQLPGPDESPLTLSQPERLRHELGAVIDVRTPGGEGLPVLAVTPGSAAERIGLQAGDRLLAINDRDFRGGTAGADALQQALAARDGQLELRVARDGQALALAGAADPVVVPAYSLTISASSAGAGCGRVSTFDTAPRNQHIYPAILIAVDGRLPGPTGAETFRLGVGKHVLTVAEAIDPVQFDDIHRVQRDRMLRDRYKTLEIDVQADTTYRLGARFILEKRNQIRSKEYWEPVIYAQKEERCR